MTSMATREAARAEERYSLAIAQIDRHVTALNCHLGYPDAFSLDYDGPRVTFGYIGNLDAGRDDRMWMVFLPHPGRMGGPSDSIGSFRTGDAEGAMACLREFVAFSRGVMWDRPGPA